VRRTATTKPASEPRVVPYYLADAKPRSEDERVTDALARIVRWATPHPEDDAKERRRCLMHIEALARSALTR